MNLLGIIKEENYPASGGDYENYVMAYDNEASLMASMRIARKNGLHLFHGFEEGGFNGGTYVLYKDKETLPMYIKEAVESERVGRSLKDIVAFFTGDIHLLKVEDKYVVFDDYHLWEPDFDYGVLSVLSEKDLKNGIRAQDVISEGLIDSEINFMLNDELLNHYKLNRDLVKKFAATPFEYWSYLAREAGYDKLWHDLDPVCRFVSGVKLRGLTDKEIGLIPEADGVYKENADKFFEEERER